MPCKYQELQFLSVSDKDSIDQGGTLGLITGLRIYIKIKLLIFIVIVNTSDL